MAIDKETIIVELPNKPMFSRKEVSTLLSIGLSTLDSCIPDSELPRIRLSKHVFVLREDLQAYILQHRSTGGK